MLLKVGRNKSMALEHRDRFSWIFWNYYLKSKEKNRQTKHFRSSEAAAHNNCSKSCILMTNNFAPFHSPPKKI